MTGCRREPAVTCNQSSPEFFCKHDVGRIIGGQIVTQLPNPGQQNEVGIASDSQVEQVLDSLIRAMCGGRAFPHQTPQYLADLKIEQVRSMEGFVMRVNPILNALSRSGLKQPVYRGGRVEDNHTRLPVIVPAFFLHVLLGPGWKYRAGRQPARAYAGGHVTRSKLAAPRSLEFQLTDSPIMTCPRLRHGLSECGGGRPAHSEAGSSLTCVKHTFMWSTCQAG